MKSLRNDLLPTNVEADLITLRNIAIHGRNRTGDKRWEDITVHDAIKAVRLASAIVDAAHSLDGLLGVEPPTR